MKSSGLGQSEAGWTILSRVKGHPISLVKQGLGSASWAFIAAIGIFFLLNLYYNLVLPLFVCPEKQVVREVHLRCLPELCPALLTMNSFLSTSCHQWHFTGKVTSLK